MEVRNEDSFTADGLRSQANRAWSQPRLSVLGDVCSLTETGSMTNNESPLNWCWFEINMTGTGCMG